MLDESLATAPKLTDKQIAALSLIFLFRYTQDGGLVNDEALGAYFDKYVEPIASNVATSVASFQHLEFTGCGTVGAFQFIPEQNLAKSCQGLFVKGFDPQEIGSRGIPMEHVRGLFMPCVNDPTKLQVKALNQEVLEALLASLSISAEESLKVQELFDANKMSHEEIRAKCVKLRPYMDNVFDTWSDSSMKSFTLTSVGIAIGHANIKRIIGQEFADLSVWIN